MAAQIAAIVARAAPAITGSSQSVRIDVYDLGF